MPRSPRQLLACGLAALTVVAGCRARLDATERRAAPEPIAVARAIDPPAASQVQPAVQAPVEGAKPESAAVLRLRVPGDLPASVVRAPDGGPPRTVFLPGLCSNASAYLQGFPEAARTYGGVVALDGDLPCPGAPGFRSFSGDAARQHGRIEAALAAAGVVAVPAEGLTLIGYSLGATIAERLVERWPGRYTRVVLIGSPRDPSPARVRSARAVVTMSCSLDVPGRMRNGARNISAAGAPAAYFEMPGCTHGNLTDGDRIFGEVFGWLSSHERAPKADAHEEPIVGLLAR
jgi:pimeloyl-ACP methyl ester carboxylesterase